MLGNQTEILNTISSSSSNTNNLCDRICTFFTVSVVSMPLFSSALSFYSKFAESDPVRFPVILIHSLIEKCIIRNHQINNSEIRNSHESFSSEDRSYDIWP